MAIKTVQEHVNEMTRMYGMWVGDAAVYDSENLWNLTPVNYLEHVSSYSPCADAKAEEMFLRQFYPEDEMEDVLCRLYNYRTAMAEMYEGQKR
jgi:hypothetical protein